MIRRIFKLLVWLISLLSIFYGYLSFTSQTVYPVDYGISFSPEYARSLGLDAGEVYNAMLTDLKPEYIRLAAMWKDVESVKNQYDFSDIDWYMNRAKEEGVKVVLVVGQKAPRWPECHVPKWLDYGAEASKEHLLGYVRATVEHYKDHEALEFWQVENEAFIHFTFGECDGYIDDAIYEEIKIVKELDNTHKVLVTDSGELGVWYKASKAGDYFGTTLYRIVRTPKGSIVTYDWLPPAFYRVKAKVLGIDMDKFFVAELQGEPWFDSGNPQDTPIEVQEETMNPARLAMHMDFTSRIGVKRAYLWGVEWWYFMKEVHDDDRYWQQVQYRLK